MGLLVLLCFLICSVLTLDPNPFWPLSVCYTSWLPPSFQPWTTFNPTIKSKIHKVSTGVSSSHLPLLCAPARLPWSVLEALMSFWIRVFRPASPFAGNIVPTIFIKLTPTQLSCLSFNITSSGITWFLCKKLGFSAICYMEMVKDREDCCAAVHGVAKSRTWLSNWTTTAICHLPYRSGVTPSQSFTLKNRRIWTYMWNFCF